MPTLPLNWLNRCYMRTRALTLHETGLEAGRKLLPIPEVDQRVRLERGWVFHRLHWGDFRLRLFRQSGLDDWGQWLQEAHQVYCQAQLKGIHQQMLEMAEQFELQMAGRQRYWRHSQIEDWLPHFAEIAPYFQLLDRFEDLQLKVTDAMRALAKLLADPEGCRHTFNQMLMEQQQARYKTFFDQLEAHPLTQDQRLACLTDEDNVLVLAGAGTGKTSTLCAKAAWLVEAGLAQPEEILILAYGKDASLELKQRLAAYAERQQPLRSANLSLTTTQLLATEPAAADNTRMDKVPDAAKSAALDNIKVSTFHAFGKELMDAIPGQKATVSPLATDARAMRRFVDDWLHSQFAELKSARHLVIYAAYYLYPLQSEECFTGFPAYQRYVREQEVRTLAGERVKSYGELEIANTLFLLGIEYQYEPGYPHTHEVLNKPYRPDFYLPQLDIYLEHVGGSDEQSKDAESRQYRQDLEWKREVHATCGTTLICTYSHEAQEGLAALLEARLKAACRTQKRPWKELIQPRAPQAILEQLQRQGQTGRLSQLLADCLSRFKESRLSLKDMQQSGDQSLEGRRLAAFAVLLEGLVKHYQQYLRLAGQMDFSDMIRVAWKSLAKDNFHSKTQHRFRYRYLLVDEFQDISPQRAELLKALKAADPSTSLFAVGDDWQAIYRFNGGDVRLTFNFAEHFGHTAQVVLGTTFRFNNRIAAVANRFVQSNPAQLPKTLQSLTSSNRAEIVLLAGQKEEVIGQALAAIQQENQQTEKTVSVMLLARMNRSEPDVSEWTDSYPGLRLEFMTAHKAKGCEADYVILLDVVQGETGFPSNKPHDPLIDCFLADKEEFADAEERRLFYVALTRARRRVFIHTQRGEESVFVKELQRYKKEVLNWV